LSVVDRDEIIDALSDLAAELQQQGTSADMYVVGGAVFRRRAVRE